MLQNRFSLLVWQTNHFSGRFSKPKLASQGAKLQAWSVGGTDKSWLYGMVDVWLPALPVVIANLLHHIISFQIKMGNDKVYRRIL